MTLSRYLDVVEWSIPANRTSSSLTTSNPCLHASLEVVQIVNQLIVKGFTKHTSQKIWALLNMSACARLQEGDPTIE